MVAGTSEVQSLIAFFQHSSISISPSFQYSIIPSSVPIFHYSNLPFRRSARQYQRQMGIKARGEMFHSFLCVFQSFIIPDGRCDANNGTIRPTAGENANDLIQPIADFTREGAAPGLVPIKDKALGVTFLC